MCLEKTEQLLLGHSDSDFQRHQVGLPPPSLNFVTLVHTCGWNILFFFFFTEYRRSWVWAAGRVAVMTHAMPLLATHSSHR